MSESFARVEDLLKELERDAEKGRISFYTEIKIAAAKTSLLNAINIRVRNAKARAKEVSIKSSASLEDRATKRVKES